MPLVGPESNDRIPSQKEIAQRLGLTLGGLLLLTMRFPTRAIALISGAIKEWKVGANFDPATDISNIAQNIVEDTQTRDKAHAENMQKWLPREGETSIGPGWTIRNDDDF